MRGRNSSPAASGVNPACTALAGATRLAMGIAALTVEPASVEADGIQSATSPSTPGAHTEVTTSAAAVTRLLATVATTSAAVDVIIEDDVVVAAVVFMNEGVQP